MSGPRAVAPVLTELFTEAMTQLVCGVAVVTARRADGTPGGLLVSSICSYSVQPPSVLIVIDQSTRSYAALTGCEEFGAHLLGRDHTAIADTFAGKADDKFAGLSWGWDGAVPRLDDVPVYLNCVLGTLFRHGDHAIVIGVVKNGHVRPSEPLVRFRRALNWQLRVAPQGRQTLRAGEDAPRRATYV
jgi:flavin reductase ActVB